LRIAVDQVNFMKNRTGRTCLLLFVGGIFALVTPFNFAENKPPTSQPSADPLPVLATSPEKGTKATVVPIPVRPFMPPAVTAHNPRLLPGDAQHPLKAGRSNDLPAVADRTLQDLPAVPQLPVGPPVRIGSVNSADIPVATIAAHPDTARTTLQTDPTQNIAVAAALLVTPPPRIVPAPFLLLTIPDPSHQAGDIPESRLDQKSIPEVDLDRPALPPLAVDAK
jgi:hypothetical protein